MTNQLVTKDHFSDLRTQIEQIKKDNKNIVFDYEADEKKARSHVATLRKSKTAINNLHKEKKKFFLEEGRKIDAGKNELIADVEEMIAVHAEPLQVIKDRKEAEEEIERQKVIVELDYEEAIEMNNFFNDKRDLEIEKAKIQKVKDDQLAKEEAEQAEKERLENEARIKKEAEEKATKDAEEKIFFEQQEKARLINEAADREKKIKDDAGNARVHMLKEINIILDFESCKNMDEAVWVEFYDSKNKIFVKERQDKWVADQKEEQRLKTEAAEKKRLQDIEDAKIKAKKEQDEALEAQRKEQEEKAKADAKIKADAKAEQERKAANTNHQASVNRKVVAKLLSSGRKVGDLNPMTEDEAKAILKDLIKNPIPEISINYGNY